MLVAENTLNDGKNEMVLVNTTSLDNTTIVPYQDPNQIRDQLVHQMIKTELEDIISTCKEIGSTDGKGDAQRDADSSTSNITSAAANAEKASDVTKYQTPNETLETEAEQQAQQQAEQQAKATENKAMHDLIWNHNVFWALLHVAMVGNSSIFTILSDALGKNADLLEGNQYVTEIITKLNNDIQSLVAGNLSPAQEADLIKDIADQLNALQHVVDPNATGTDPDPAKSQEAHNSLGPDLNAQLNTLIGDYNSEMASIGKSGLSFEQLYRDLTSSDPTTKAYAQNMFNELRGDMINQSGTKSPGSGPTGIYSRTSSMLTSLNTSGSQFMAQQNLDTKELDQVEKLETTASTTFQSINQTVIGNIAN